MLDVRISSCSNGIRKIRKISMTEETGTGDCPHLFHRHHRLLLPRNATHAYKCNLFPKNSEGELRSLRRSMHDQHTFWMRGKQGRKGGERKTVWPFSKTSVIRPAIYQLTCLASPVSGASFFSSSSSSWTFHEPGVKSISLHLKSKSQWPKILMEKSSW